MKESAESIINRVLEPGEQVVWSGRPHSEIARKVSASRMRKRTLVGLAVSILVILWLLFSGIVPNPLESLNSVPLEPSFMVPIGVVLLLMVVPRMLKVDPASRLNRYFDSLTYAITDRRLLILEGDKVSEAYTPERLREPRIRERAPGYADVIFDQRPTGNVDRGRSRDPVFLERAEVGFKALSNAREVRQLLERWIDDHHRQAADQVAGFVDATPAVVGAEAPAGRRRIVNRALGLALNAPEAWKIQVRQKKKPQGQSAWDVERWQEPGTAVDWNVIRIEGPSHCRIEAEVFETEPTVSFHQLAHSRLADSISGKVIDSSEDYEVNGVRGFFVTRRNELAVDPATGKAGIAAVVAPERHTVLHDGRRQACIVTTWPEDSVDLQRVVHAVVESIELG